MVSYVALDRIYWWVGLGDGYAYLDSGPAVLDGQWHHLTCRRQGENLSLWVDGVLQDSQTNPAHAGSFFAAWDPRAIGLTYGGAQAGWPFAMADLRAYDRALSDEEIAGL
jgi:hypothetical protein